MGVHVAVGGSEGCFLLEERLEVWDGMAGRRRSPKLTEKAERTSRLDRPKSAQGAQDRRERVGTQYAAEYISFSIIQSVSEVFYCST